ncbi:hypothetical protein Tco_1096064 [Tanacetum coccineum]
MLAKAEASKASSKAKVEACKSMVQVEACGSKAKLQASNKTLIVKIPGRGTLEVESDVNLLYDVMYIEIIKISSDSSKDRKGASKVNMYQSQDLCWDYQILLHGMKLKRKWEPRNQKLMQIRQRGKERCHVEADHALAFDQSFLGSLTCLHIAFAACICTLHLQASIFTLHLQIAYAHCICTLHLQASICTLHLHIAFVG